MIEKLFIYLGAFTIGFNFPIITIFISTFFLGALIAKTRKATTQ